MAQSSSLSGFCTRACFPRIAPATWANDPPLVTATNRSVPMACGPNVDQAWRGGRVARSCPVADAVRGPVLPEPGSDRPVPMAPSRVALLAAGDETLEAHITDWGEMLTRFRALLRRVRASQRRRAQLSGDPLLPPVAERARARATLDYYSREVIPPAGRRWCRDRWPWRESGHSRMRWLPAIGRWGPVGRAGTRGAPALGRPPRSVLAGRRGPAVPDGQTDHR